MSETFFPEDLPDGLPAIDYFAEEAAFTQQYWDWAGLWQFQQAHRLEVIMQDDCQYHCYVDYEPGEGSWGSGLTALSALLNGYLKYKRYNPSTK